MQADKEGPIYQAGELSEASRAGSGRADSWQARPGSGGKGQPLAIPGSRENPHGLAQDPPGDGWDLVGSRQQAAFSLVKASLERVAQVSPGRHPAALRTGWGTCQIELSRHARFWPSAPSTFCMAANALRTMCMSCSVQQAAWLDSACAATWPSSARSHAVHTMVTQHSLAGLLTDILSRQPIFLAARSLAQNRPGVLAEHWAQCHCCNLGCTGAAHEAQKVRGGCRIRQRAPAGCVCVETRQRRGV